ncbi:MAG: transcription termination/antitermination NusG family protein [Alphaproteobacteria bacterium]
MKRWYVVYTRTGMERMAQGHLERQGFTTYLPRRRKERRHARRVDSVLVPFFPRYLFVAFDIEKDPWRSVNGTWGVSYLVGAGDTVSAVPEGVIESIQERENAEGLIEIEEAPPFAPGEVVEITRGALVAQTGIFKCANDNQRVTLLLSLLGREMEINVPANTVRGYG